MAFDNLSQLKHLDFIEANGAQELKDKLKAITYPTHVISIYSQGSKHYAWILTEAKLIKQKKEIK